MKKHTNLDDEFYSETNDHHWTDWLCIIFIVAAVAYFLAHLIVYLI